MNPIEFESVNQIYAKDQKEYRPLPAHCSEDGTVTTCWELTDEELAEIVKTKRMFLQQLTFRRPLQPVMLSVAQPELSYVPRVGDKVVTLEEFGTSDQQIIPQGSEAVVAEVSGIDRVYLTLPQGTIVYPNKLIKKQE